MADALTDHASLPLNMTDVARIWRKVYGGAQADASAFEFADAIMRAALSAPAEPVASVSRSHDLEGLVQWAGKRVPVGALLYAAPAAPAGWQPIETAPKDGSMVMLWLRSPYSRVDLLRWEPSVSGWVSEHWDKDSEGFCGSLVPSHWMPLPAAPTHTGDAPETMTRG